jgi:DnaJ like chaperone protein
MSNQLKNRLFNAILNKGLDYFKNVVDDIFNEKKTSTESSDEKVYQTRTEQKQTSIGNYQYAHFILILASTFSNKSAVYHNLQAEILKKFLNLNFNEAELNIIIRNFKYVSPLESEIGNTCDQLKNKVSYALRLKTINLLYNLVAVKKFISKDEAELIDVIGILIGIKEDVRFNLKIDYVHFFDNDSQEQSYQEQSHQQQSNQEQKKEQKRNEKKTTTKEDAEDLLYKKLGLTKTATDDEIKKAYRSLAKRFHPDKYAHRGKVDFDKAQEKFKQITEAYQKIRDKRNF